MLFKIQDIYNSRSKWLKNEQVFSSCKVFYVGLFSCEFVLFLFCFGVFRGGGVIVRSRDWDLYLLAGVKHS